MFTSGFPVVSARHVRCALLAILLLILSILEIQAQEQLPPPDAYVQVRDGHLFRNGARLRLWGINIQGPDFKGRSSHALVDANIQRLDAMGFNAVRLWGGRALIEWRNGKRIQHTYTKGDGSPLDLMDYTIAQLKEKGIVIWLTWFDTHTLTSEDVDLVNDPATRERWPEAVRAFQQSRHKKGQGLVFYFDPRAREAFKKHIRTILTHKNQWTGLALKDEPIIAIYELDNERQFMDQMLGPRGKTGHGHARVEEVLPPFFAENLQSQWNRYLLHTYGTEEALRRAWGQMDSGEQLRTGTVRLQPTYATAKAYPAARGSDIVAFYRSLFMETCADLKAYIRSFGAADRGAQVVPIICHTIGSDHGLHLAASNAVGDAIAYGHYWMQYADQGRKQRKPPLHDPWYSFVEQGPKWGFLHPYKQVNKPLLLYETNAYRTDKFRAEFPLLHAIGGSWSDLDGIFYYQWDYGFTRDQQRVVTDRLYYPTTDHGWHGVTMYSDEVFLAQMRTAGRLFLQGLVRPPPQPTVVRYGQDQLNNAHQPWYGVLHGLLPTALRYGVELAIDPKASESKVEGPTVEAKAWNGKEWRIGEELVWNVERGSLMLDLPTVKAAAGFLPPELVFRDGVKVQGVRKLRFDPDDVAPRQGDKPRTDRPYYCFTLVSDDGLPLAQSKRILLSLVSTSQNLGFQFDPAKVPHTGSDAQKLAHGIVSAGTAPVQVNRVGATIVAPLLKGKQYHKLDFALQVFEKGIASDTFVITPDQPLFIALLE